jgi:hypothetical protein
MNICGKPNAKVRVCVDPLLGGVSEAMKPERLEEIFQRYDGMIDIYVLCVDRDAVQTRDRALENLENRFSDGRRRFFCVAAREELETWLLAGQDLPADWRWPDIRKERDVKEAYFLPFAKMKGIEFSPGQGRRLLGQSLRAQINRVIQRCPDELNVLVGKISAALQPA